MNITGTLTAVSIGQHDAVLTIETDAGPARVIAGTYRGALALEHHRRRVRCDVQWLPGGAFGLIGGVKPDRCGCCEAPTGPDCEDCGARETRPAVG